MRVDLYRRSESDHKFSYLVVPHGQPLPQEVTNVDWAISHQDLGVDEAAEHLQKFRIDHPRQQIEEKGYAITSVNHQLNAQELPPEDDTAPRAGP